MLRVVLSIGTVALLIALGGVAVRGMAADTPKFITGNVYDAVTKEPLEGVYLLGSYRHCGSGIALGHVGSNCPCSLTVGMKTGRDGSFRLPLAANSGWPAISAFFVGRYVKSTDFPYVPSHPSAREKAQSFDGLKIWMAPQAPGTAYPHYSAVPYTCTEVYGDASKSAAGSEFTSLVEAEKLRLAPDSGATK